MQFEKDRNEKDREHAEEIRRVRKDAAETEKQKTSLINSQLEQSKSIIMRRTPRPSRRRKRENGWPL